MVTARSHFIDANTARLHVVEWGTQTQAPVLLIHGGSAHAYWWTYIVSALVARHRVLAVDLRGHGDSAWVDPPDYSIETHAKDIAALAAALELHDLSVVGHSLGGMVTIASAAPLGARLRAMALVDTNGRLGAKSLRYLKTLSHWPDPVYSSREDGVRRFRLLPSANSTADAIRAHVASHALKNRGDGTWTLKFDRRALAFSEPIDLTPKLHDIVVPTLIVRGALSAQLSARSMAELASCLRNVATAEIAGAHHHVMLDAPDDLALVLTQFLDRAAAPCAAPHG